MLLNIFFIILKQCLQTIPLVVQSLGVKSGLYCRCSNNYQPNLFNFLYCLTGVLLCGKSHCHAEEWHLSAADLIAFCKLLVVIDQSVMYSNSAFTLHPWDIKFTRTTHCLSKKTQTIPLPADEFLRAWWRHMLPLHRSPLAFWHLMMNPCLIRIGICLEPPGWAGTRKVKPGR